MSRTPDDAARLMNLLVAICGPEISIYRPQLEALVLKQIKQEVRAGKKAA